MSRTVTTKLPAALAQLNPDAWSAPFWEAARRHELSVPRCADCGAYRMPPAPFCWSCRSDAVEWQTLAGTGVVYSYTVVTHPPTPILADAVPFAVAVVSLDGAPGARLVLAVAEADPHQVRIGMPVDIAWEDLGDGVTVPRAAPV